jgi:hypothetical protein
MRKGIIIFLSLYLALNKASAQEVIVTSAFDTSRIFIGDQINYTVTIDKPVSYILSGPVFKDTLFKSIEILKGPSTDTSLLKNGSVRIIQKYLVTSFDSGFYQVPPVYAELRTGNAIKRFYSDYSPLEVLRVKITPPDSTEAIFDIVAPYRAPLTLGEVLPWVLLAIVVAASAWYGYKLIKKLRRPKDQPAEEVKPDPAHIIAFRALEKLRDEQLWQRGEIKLYYTRLSEILREYLENRYAVSSLELTTVETLDELKKTGFREDDTFRMLKTVLTGSDLVKFAKYFPEPHENDIHYNYAWDFVSFTRDTGPEKVQEPVAENVQAEERKEVTQ